MSISERLRAAMSASGVSQAELARRCGVKPPSVSGWLSAKAKFLRAENLLAAAKVLGVSEQWLATGAGDMHVDHIKPGSDQELSDNMILVDSDMHRWLALREDLGRDDIEEFVALIQARQKRNRRLIEELTGKAGRAMPELSHDVEVRPIGKTQSSQSS